MSFKEMMKSDLSGLYQSLGDEAVFSGTSLDPALGTKIFVIPEEDFDIETAEYKKFRAIASDVVEIEEGQTLLMDGVVNEIKNFKPSDDGLEMYISVK